MKLNLNKINYRIAKGRLRKQDVARRIGRGPAWMSQILKRVRAGEDLSPRMVGQLARALRVSIDEILDGREAG